MKKSGERGLAGRIALAMLLAELPILFKADVLSGHRGKIVFDGKPTSCKLCLEACHGLELFHDLAFELGNRRLVHAICQDESLNVATVFFQPSFSVYVKWFRLLLVEDHDHRSILAA